MPGGLGGSLLRRAERAWLRMDGPRSVEIDGWGLAVTDCLAGSDSLRLPPRDQLAEAGRLWLGGGDWPPGTARGRPVMTGSGPVRGWLRLPGSGRDWVSWARGGRLGFGSGWAGLAAWGSLGLAGARWLRLQGPGSQGVDDPRRLALAGAGLG